MIMLSAKTFTHTQTPTHPHTQTTLQTTTNIKRQFQSICQHWRTTLLWIYCWIYYRPMLPYDTHTFFTHTHIQVILFFFFALDPVKYFNAVYAQWYYKGIMGKGALKGWSALITVICHPLSTAACDLGQLKYIYIYISQSTKTTREEVRYIRKPLIKTVISGLCTPNALGQCV